MNQERHWLDPLLVPDEPIEVVVFGHTRCSEQWEVGPRSLPEDLIYVIEDGVAAGTCGDSRVRFEAGTAFWWPAGTHHHLHTVPGQRPITVYHLRVHHPAGKRPPITTRRSDGIREAMQRLFDDWRTPLDDQLPRLRAQLALLLSEFERADSDGGGTVLSPAQRAAVLALVDGSDPASRLHPGQLARAAGLSPAWFSRVFTRTYGCSPRSWLKRHRIERAAQRLAESTATISEIAAEFGYDELFRFSRQFRVVMGTAPRTWRRRHQPPRQQ